MGQNIAAAPERLVVRMGDDNGGAGPRVGPHLIERDCHGVLRMESEHRLSALFDGRFRSISTEHAFCQRPGSTRERRGGRGRRRQSADTALLSSILWFRTGETVSLRSLAEMLANVMLT